MNKIHIAVIGGGAVGKSALVHKFLNPEEELEERYDPTISSTYSKDVTIDDELYVVEILDTAGQDEYKTMREEFITSADGFIIVFNVADINSFEECSSLFEQILSTKNARKRIPVVLVANKCELEQRIIEKQQGEELALQLGEKCEYFEASAKNNINVEAAFMALINQMIPNKKIDQAQDSSKKDSKKPPCSIL